MKVKRKWTVWMMVLALLIGALAVPNGAQAASKKVKVKKVTSVSSITGSRKIYLAKGKTVKLSTAVSVTPDKAANKKVTYKTSNKKIATVTGKGVIKGKKAGNAKITVTSKKDSKKKAVVTVKVLKGKVTGIDLDKIFVALTVGDSVKLKADVKISKGGRKYVAWASSKENVASVKNGTVTAVGEGEAVITVKAADGSGKKAECKVTVKAASPATEEKPVPEKPATAEKNASDAAILQGIINGQIALGAKVPADLDDSSYTWDKKTGRLTGINWYMKDGSGLQGAISFEGLTALTALRCDGYQPTGQDQQTDRNRLTSIDVGGCAALESLDCSVNELTSLDVSGCAALESLNCSDNELASLDVSGCAALESLDCSGNELASLDVSGCEALKSLDCSQNQLIGLDCPKNRLIDSGKIKYPPLATLYCYENKLTSLDVSDCIALTWLDCSKNQLIRLDCPKKNQQLEEDVPARSGYPSLSTLYCSKNQLTSLDVSDCTALIRLDCSQNQLIGLDCPKSRLIDSGETEYPPLETLYCSKNQLTSLDVSDCTALIRLDCSKNRLTSLDVGGNTKLAYLSCGDSEEEKEGEEEKEEYPSNQLTSLDVGKNTELTYLDCSGNQLTSLDVGSCTELTYLDCSKNQLASLDVGNCMALTTLDYSENLLVDEKDDSDVAILNRIIEEQNSLGAKVPTDLDSSAYLWIGGRLRRINWAYCNLQKNLSFEGLTGLKRLSCPGNQLTGLDVGSCTELTWLDCFGNQLTGLDVGSCTELTWLDCSDNQLASLNVANCTMLASLYYDTDKVTVTGYQH